MFGKPTATRKFGGYKNFLGFNFQVTENSYNSTFIRPHKRFLLKALKQSEKTENGMLSTLGASR